MVKRKMRESASDDSSKNECGGSQEKKKPPRQPSLIVKQLGKGAKRYMVIALNLETSIKKGYENKKNIIAEFSHIADYEGTVRHLVGLFANYLASKHGSLPAPLNKTFLDRVWSAIEKWVYEPDTASKKSDTITVEVGNFLKTCGFTNLREILGTKVNFDLRQRTTDDMRVSYVNHIAINFENRVRSYAKYLLSNVEAIVQEYPLVKDRGPLVTQLVNSILRPTSDNDLPNQIRQIPEVAEFIDNGRTCVQTLLSSVNTDNKEPEQSEKPLSYALKAVPHLAIPFLTWMSCQGSYVRDRIRQILEESKKMGLSRKERKVSITNQMKTQKCYIPPKSFSLLPYFKLQRCFVDYCSTEVETMFGKAVSMNSILEHMLDLDQIPQMKNSSMCLAGFRTDGFTLEVRLASLAQNRPYSPNTNHLDESGYNFPNPKGGGVDVVSQDRGIYRITEKRYDNYPVELDDVKDLDVRLVDPGVKNPVTVRYVGLEHADDVNKIIHNSDTWCISSDEYRTLSAYDVVKNRHVLRCRKNKKYQRALRALTKERKKTAIHGDVLSYCCTVASHFVVFQKEMMHRQRSKSRRLHQKKRQSAIAQIADKIVSSTHLQSYTPYKKKGEKQKRVIVIWGDGTYQTPKGCISVPRKVLAHAVSCKTLTFATSEYRSSCACPICEDGTMEDTCKGSRMRRCNSNSLTPNNPCIFSTSPIDRDNLATISMARISYDALVLQSRPVQYRNRRSPVSPDAVKRSARKCTLSRGVSQRLPHNRIV